MSINKANKKDIENIMKMYASCVKGMINIGIDQWDHTYPNKEIILQDIIKRNYFIYKIDDNIIGGVTIDTNQSPEYLQINWKDKKNEFLCVRRLAINHDFWMKGIGKEMMKFAEELAMSKNLSSIRLDTYSGNPGAMKFYKNLGYQNLGYIYLKPGKNEYYCFEKIIE